MDSTDCENEPMNTENGEKGSTNIAIMEENKKLFCLFRWSGILIKRDMRSNVKWCSALFFSRLFWFLWQVLGTGLGIWSCKRDTSNSTLNTTNMKESIIAHPQFYQYIPFIILFLLFLGPIQSNIIKFNMDNFPEILENLKELEKMRRNGKWEYKEEDNHQHPQNSGSCLSKCYSKNVLPIISILIFVILFMVSLFIVAYKFHDMKDLLDEYKLIAVMFYLTLPLLTSLFVITFINQITKLYETIYKLQDNMFTISENVEKVSEYLGLLQETVEIMMSNIFEFTLGINFAIFVSSSVMCSYELVEGIKNATLSHDVDGTDYMQLTNSFAEIDYLIPLFLSLLPMFWICKVSDNLMKNVHAKLCLRIRRLLPKLYLKHYDETPDDWSDKPFKKLEFLYKTLNRWPPQVYIYGGWRVNYQLLSAIVLFIFANARFTLK